MNAIVNTNNNNEPTQFEYLPTEIMYFIFNYLTGDKILQSFSYLNERLNSRIENYPLKTVDFSDWTIREITTFFKCSYNTISTYSLSLKVTNKISYHDSYSANIEFMFSLLMDYDQLKYLFGNLQQLILIRPIIDIDICLPDIILRSFIISSLHDKIICKKSISQQRIDKIMICNDKVMRSFLVDNGGVYNELLIYDQNPIIKTIMPNQWIYMSPLITNTISELTLLIIDERFTCYDGHVFSSLLPNLSNDCHLHFYLQIILDASVIRTGINLLFQSFQNDFYIQHQSNVTIAYCGNVYRNSDQPSLIYTSPFCASKFTLNYYQEIVGIPSNYNNITRLALDPYSPDYTNILSSNNQPDFLSNLTTLELIDARRHIFNQMNILPIMNFQQIASRIRHIYFCTVHHSTYFIASVWSSCSFDQLRYLDIADSNGDCSILYDIFEHTNFCQNVVHLNISGLCHLRNSHIKDISVKFSNLQTLKCSMKMNSHFNKQLDTICECILVNMRSHVHYIHIYFEREQLLIMAMEPNETQLSEWLGHNQQQLSHVQVIELTRNELSAWL